jgi:hypothetical protein
MALASGKDIQTLDSGEAKGGFRGHAERELSLLCIQNGTRTQNYMNSSINSVDIIVSVRANQWTNG